MTISAAITILGLGPGPLTDLTLEAHGALTQAAKNQQMIYFRTLIHPTIEPLMKALPEMRTASFDHLYDQSIDWETLYQQIAQEVCTLAAQEPIIYAVPGHPLVGETSVQLILQLARERGLSTSVIAGLSFLEPVCTALQLDPLAIGTQLVDATVLAALGPHEVAGKIIPTMPLLVAQLYNRRLASAVKLALGECYPDEWPVKLIRAAGSITHQGQARPAPPAGTNISRPRPGRRQADAPTIDGRVDPTSSGGDLTLVPVGERKGTPLLDTVGLDTDETVVEMPLYQLDRNNLANHLSTLYVPPLDELTSLRLPETLRYITMRLRREPDGCPWDREQTHQSLTRHLIEETYEVVEALEEGDMEKLPDELGDLLLQVYLHSEIARQEGDFAIGDVFEHVNAKLIRRHPHVFGTVEVDSTGEVLQNWDAIKRQERVDAGKDVHSESVLDGVPPASPALIISQEYQKRAAKLGFDYPNLQRVLTKLSEELQELQEATTPEGLREEMGDVLFMVARAARELKIDAEEALRLANRKFRQRFQAMEGIIREEGRTFDSYTLEEWVELWQRVKKAGLG